ncbi:YehR family protein [Vagococcus salmoninarum]|uniref:YehR family protein n=1 Tax=Vagococcus salmoninarum TaxID=2739 RepID=UPI00187E6F41|nr:YehR family protein [Vagococcus salmoninarum]MBE9388987.1 YehR family protein [Vagococcus salmoninarum]
MKKWVKVLVLMAVGLTVGACSAPKEKDSAKESKTEVTNESTKESVSETKESTSKAKETTKKSSEKADTKNAQTKKFTQKMNGVEIFMTYTYKGDIVMTQATNSKAIYSEMGITKEDAEEMFAPIEEQYAGVKGVKHSIDYGDDSMTEITEVDYTVADYKEITQLTGSMSDGAEDPTFVSMRQSEKLLLDNGYTLVEE